MVITLGCLPRAVAMPGHLRLHSAHCSGPHPRIGHAALGDTTNGRSTAQIAMQTQLSSYGQASSRPSPVSRMMSEFAGTFRDGVDINLGVGYVNEKTIPVASLVEAMQAVANDPAKYRQAFNYGSPAGSGNLIASIRRFLIGEPAAASWMKRRSRANVSPSEPAARPAFSMHWWTCCRRGIVVTSDPMYYIYTEGLMRKGFDVLAVPEDDEGIDLDILERKLEALGDAAQPHLVFLHRHGEQPVVHRAVEPAPPRTARCGNEAIASAGPADPDLLRPGL